MWPAEPQMFALWPFLEKFAVPSLVGKTTEKRTITACCVPPGTRTGRHDTPAGQRKCVLLYLGWPGKVALMEMLCELRHKKAAL